MGIDEWSIKELSHDSPIEEYDIMGEPHKGTTKINTGLWGVIELDPCEWKCNGKYMASEEMAEALWGEWEIQNEKYFVRGRRHIACSIMNWSGLKDMIIE